MKSFKKSVLLFTMLTVVPTTSVFAQSTGTIAVLPPTGNGQLPNPFPSGVVGSPQKPLSSEKMTVDSQHIDSQVAKAMSDAQARMQEVHVGGSMDTVHEDMGTLQSEIDTSKSLRAMAYQQAKVEAATKLWGATYDGKREEEKTDNKKEASANTPSKAESNTQHEEELAREKNLKLQQEKDDAEEKAKQHAMFINERRSLAASIPPVISSIYGPSNNLQAIILVPYIGAKNVKTGDRFAYIDGAYGVVSKITSENVYVKKGGVSYELVFGNHVPSRNEIINLLSGDPSQKSKNDQNAP